MSKRDHISLTTKLAAVLLEMKVADEKGNLVPWIDRELAKELTAAQICSLVEFDHYPVPKALGGDDHPTNLVALPIMAHRKKTATKDVPAIAKSNRISRAHEDFKRRILAKVTGDAPEEAPKRKAVMPGSRASGFRKKINGRVERR